MEGACPITCCAGFVVLDSTSKLSNFATSEVDGIRHNPGLVAEEMSTIHPGQAQCCLVV